MLKEKPAPKIDLPLFTQAEQIMKVSGGGRFEVVQDAQQAKGVIEALVTQLTNTSAEVTATPRKLEITFPQPNRLQFATSLAITRPITAQIDATVILGNGQTPGTLVTTNLGYADNIPGPVKLAMRMKTGNDAEGHLRTTLANPSQALSQVIGEQMRMRGIALTGAGYYVENNTVRIVLTNIPRSR